MTALLSCTRLRRVIWLEQLWWQMGGIQLPRYHRGAGNIIALQLLHGQRGSLAVISAIFTAPWYFETMYNLLESRLTINIYDRGQSSNPAMLRAYVKEHIARDRFTYKAIRNSADSACGTKVTPKCSSTASRTGCAFPGATWPGP